MVIDPKSKRYAVLLLVVLTCVNLLNYLDRYIFSALLPAIQKDLHFSDTQMGVLGSGFVFAYLLTSPFFGVIGDRLRRFPMMIGGIVVWSVATAFSGISRTFSSQLFTRVVVGVGEAGYTVLVPSVLVDVFKPRHRGLVFAIYSGAIPVGAALGFVLGGILESRVGWSRSFFIVGIPGVLLALALLFFREPVRGVLDGDNTGLMKHPAWDFRSLYHNKPYLFTVFGYTAYTFVVGGMAFWMPTYLVRFFDVSLQKANLVFGGVTVVGGFLGTFLGGTLADFWETKSGNGYMKVCALAMLFSAPLYGIALCISDFNVFIVVFLFLEILLFMCISPLDAAIMSFVEPGFRATASAMTVFLIHFLGDGISRGLVGRLSDITGSLRTGMIIFPWVLMVAFALWLWGLVEHWHGLPWPDAAGEPLGEDSVSLLRKNLPLSQAHRGFWSEGIQENTLDAFRAAVARGAKMIELDVRLAANGEVVVVHDTNLLRVVGQPLEVADLLPEELSSRARVPLLVTVLRELGAKVFFNIEIKSETVKTVTSGYAIEGQVVKAIREAGCERRVLVSSFNPMVLFRISKISQLIPRALLVSNEQHPKNKTYLRRTWLGWLARPHLLHCDHTMLTPKRLESLRRRKILVVAWTVNDMARAQELLAEGVSSVISDRPEIFANTFLNR